MRRFTCFAIVAAISIAGCAKEYEPPAESIPVIKPGRGALGADAGPAGSSGKKGTGGAGLTVPK